MRKTREQIEQVVSRLDDLIADGEINVSEEIGDVKISRFSSKNVGGRDRYELYQARSRDRSNYSLSDRERLIDTAHFTANLKYMSRKEIMEYMAKR